MLAHLWEISEAGCLLSVPPGGQVGDSVPVPTSWLAPAAPATGSLGTRESLCMAEVSRLLYRSFRKVCQCPADAEKEGEEKSAEPLVHLPHFRGRRKERFSGVGLLRVTRSEGCLPFLDPHGPHARSYLPSVWLPCPGAMPPHTQSEAARLPKILWNLQNSLLRLQMLPESGVEREKLWVWAGGGLGTAGPPLWEGLSPPRGPKTDTGRLSPDTTSQTPVRQVLSPRLERLGPGFLRKIGL